MLSALLSNLNNLTSTMNGLSSSSGQVSKALSFLLNMLDSGNTSSTLIGSAISQFQSTYSFALSGISLIFALIGCFFGYKLSRLFMAISGFLAGICIGTLIGANILKASNGVIILCGIIGGFILAFFAYRIYQAGIFLLCFFLAFIAGANTIPVTGDIQFFLCTVLAFIVGTLAIKYVRPVIILASAFVCAHTASQALMIIGPKTNIAFFQNSYAQIASFAVLMILGILIQFLTTSDPDAKSDKK